jgi:hypothetical protein
MFAWLVLKAPASVNSNEKAITVDLFAHDVFGRRCFFPSIFEGSKADA